MNRLITYAFLLITPLLILACGDDDSGDKFPSLQTEFVEANTGADKRIHSITTDNGLNYILTNSIMTDVADTTFRCVCNFELQDNETRATVYDIKHIYSFPPIPASQFKSLDRDPVKVQSLWHSGKYVNIILGVMTSGNGTHACAFCEDSITTSSDGTKTVHISLLHKRPDNDIEAYTQKVYLSIPVSHYADSCNAISLSIPTYEGTATYTF